MRAPSADTRYYDVKKLIHGASLNTICEEARCPNIAECWGRGTATFQILGDTCTRACRYCYVHSGTPERARPTRSSRCGSRRRRSRWGSSTSSSRPSTATTSPTAAPAHYAATIRALQAKLPEATVEVLTPDFLGVEEEALATVLGARPDVFNHNIETVRRLHPQHARRARRATTGRSALLRRAKELADYPRADEERHHRRPRRDERRGRRDDARPARARRRRRHDRPVPAAERQARADRPLGASRTSSAGSASRARRSASARSSPARSSARATAPTSSATPPRPAAAPSRTRRLARPGALPAGDRRVAERAPQPDAPRRRRSRSSSRQAALTRAARSLSRLETSGVPSPVGMS